MHPNENAMENPDNYKRQITCSSCPNKDPYIVDNKKLYSCVWNFDDDAEVDYYCGKHPEVKNSDSYQERPCCNNCIFCLKTYVKEDKCYECMKNAITKDGGEGPIEPDYICDDWKKDSVEVG